MHSSATRIHHNAPRYPMRSTPTTRRETTRATSNNARGNVIGMMLDFIRKAIQIRLLERLDAFLPSHTCSSNASHYHSVDSGQITDNRRLKLNHTSAQVNYLLSYINALSQHVSPI